MSDQMGYCYEFALDIVSGCGHAMTVAPEGGRCECLTCGARCPGRFNGCAPVLEQPGYIPLTAPAWARERTHPEQPVTWHTNGDESGEQVIDLISLRHETRELQTLTRDLRTTVDRAANATAQTATQTTTDTVNRADLARLFNGIHHEIDLATRRQAAAIDRLVDAVDRLTEQAEADRNMLRSVVEGLARLNRRVGRPPGA